MNWQRHALLSTLALMTALLPAAAGAASLSDFATTADQNAAATVFEGAGATAATGSTLKADYDRLLVNSAAGTTASVQSMLPATAYGLTGVANTLSSVEETNVMSRLHSLRNRKALAPQRVVAARTPLVKPLQETDDSFLDLRAGQRAPAINSAHSTQNNYRLYSPLLYSDTATKDTQHGAIEGAYDETMRLTAIGAGVASINTRGTAAPQRRIVPNMADRAANATLTFAGDVGGQGQMNATATGGLPRHVITPLSQEARASNANYRGQPLSQLAASNESIPVPLMASTGNAPVIYPTPSASPSVPVISGPTGAYSLTNNTMGYVPPSAVPTKFGQEIPVVTGAGSNAPAVTTKPAQPYTYKKIDQSKGFTTPRLGSPTTSTIQIPQTNSYAMASADSQTFFGTRTPMRKSSETGTLLWTNDDEDQATAPEATATPVQEKETTPLASSNKPVIYPVVSANNASDDNTPLLAQSPRESYGTQAVPLNEGSVNADRRWGYFISGNAGFGSNDLQNNVGKTKTVTTGLTVGADYHIQGNSFAGLALTYVHSNLDTGSTANLRANSTALSLYGTTSYATDAYLDGYISMGYHSLESERTILAGDSTTRKANASPDGYQFAGKAETGYDFKHAAMTYGPYAGFRLAYADFGSFTEKDAGNFNLKVQGLNNLSAIGALGFGGSQRYVMSNGGILLPSVRMAYNHEFGDDKSRIKAEFANIAGSSFSTDSAEKSRDWISFSPAISASLPNDWTLLAQYEHDFFRDDVNESIFNLAANYKW